MVEMTMVEMTMVEMTEMKEKATMKERIQVNLTFAKPLEGTLVMSAADTGTKAPASFIAYRHLFVPLMCEMTLAQYLFITKYCLKGYDFLGDFLGSCTCNTISCL
jgi:hypothetical protein